MPVGQPWELERPPFGGEKRDKGKEAQLLKKEKAVWIQMEGEIIFEIKLLRQ